MHYLSGMHRFVKELIDTAFTTIGESQVKAAFLCSMEVGKKRCIRSIGGNAISHLLFADSGGCWGDKRMVRYAVNSWVWGATDTQDIIKSIRKTDELGFDGVEIPVGKPARIDVEWISKEMGLRGQKCSSIAGILTECTGISTPKSSIRENAKRYISKCIDFAEELGAEVVGGPFYSYEAVSACVWRPLAPDQDEIARGGLQFLRKLLGSGV